ncbi:YceI family protein [Actinotalea sp. K2]|uniref:YceI family protein n=1 Tax=Actinotalea sp. K2 TaxID=2939438 RepID=UPI002017704F|nr:YceI family protein [Actinotalea sp. K2]MCL3860570.1 YceI family protein [Actinotalea sp. K2]
MSTQETPERRTGEPAPVDHRHAWRWVATVIGVLVLGMVAGPWAYARWIAPDAPGPFALSTPAPVEETEAPVDDPDDDVVEGTWVVGEGSQAGYRLAEVLSGQPVTVVGRGSEVSGTVVVAGGQLVEAQIVVGVASISTDESARDAYFRRALDTSTYPESTFVLDTPVDLGPLASQGTAVELQAVGTLTLRGVARQVTASLEVQRTADGVEVAGQVPLTLADHGLTAPDLGSVTVEPTGSVELHLLLTR